MTSVGTQSDTYPMGRGPRPQLSTRRHTDLPLDTRSMPDCWFGHDGEAQGQGAKPAHSRPSSRPRMSRRRSASAERQRASASHDASTPSMATLQSRRRSPVKDAEGSQSPVFHGSADVLSFLDADSPDMTAETIKRTLETSTQWHQEAMCTSPRSLSGLSSLPTTGTRYSPRQLPVFDTEAQASLEQSAGMDIASTTFVQRSPTPSSNITGSVSKSTIATELEAAPRRQQSKDNEYHYGTPEMPRGKANLPHLPPNALTPRASNLGQGHPKHLPRAEKLPLTGYELLAARLTAGSGRHKSRPRRHGRPQSSQPPSPSTDNGRCGPDTASELPDIKPIYRRFEALNHRLLLHLQDELSELEEQLHRLDTADTQTRRLQNCILPASRRAGHMSGSELQWHKTDILGKIGFKLGQYNHALASFREAQDLPAPDLADVETYRTYLATDSPIAEIETRFLDPTDDLVSLGPAGGARRSRSNSSSSTSSSPYGDRDRPYSPAAMSDEAPTPRQGSWASYLPKTTRFPFAGAPGGALLPTPSPSPVSSVGGCSRPTTSAGSEEAGLTTAPERAMPAFGLSHVLFSASILLPLLLFRLIGGISARLAVVLTVTTVAGVLGEVITTGGRLGRLQALARLERKDLLAYIGVYTAGLAVTAAVC